MIAWRWGLEPLRLRDRAAKNLAEALDFARRRDPIDLPHFDPAPRTACRRGGGWTELAVMPNGSVTASVEVEEARDATYRARLLVKGNEVAAQKAGRSAKAGPPSSICGSAAPVFQ